MYRPTSSRLRLILIILVALVLSGAAVWRNSEVSMQVDASSNSENRSPTTEKAIRYPVVDPQVHPRLLFTKEELPGLRERTKAPGLPSEMWQKITDLAKDWTMDGEWEKEGMQLNALALLYQVDGNEQAGQEALSLFKQLLQEIEPFEYFEKEVDSNFFETENWPKAFAYAWDWLYEVMSDEERQEIAAALERWCLALYEHTEAWWWRDASYNCGAIPVGALGLLTVALEGDDRHPEFQEWKSSALSRIRDNYYPTAWRDNGICYEGPGYAHYHKNGTQFAEALRRIGDPDLIPGSGAVNAMHYLRFQWMPQGGCGPVGDNTNYGRRVFQSVYLFGIGELDDQAGLWTFERYTDRARLNPILAFLWYPDDVRPVSPGRLDLPTSAYFEVTPHRAGYLFSRSEWDNERAHWFAFTTRYAGANHQHYDMNSFLFTAFGEQFATHANIFPYRHADHGADLEHNIVIVNEGGMPANDRTTSAGDDASVLGYLTGLGTGHFGDYVRGDARLSYQDPTVENTSPAVRADRYGIFVKQGRHPYVVMVDSIQKDADRENDYHWQWFTEAESVDGTGTLSQPIEIEGESAGCRLGFLYPGQPQPHFELVKGGSERHPIELGRIRVSQRGVEAHFMAVAAAFSHQDQPPTFEQGPEIEGNSLAHSLRIKGPDYQDLIVWQPEEVSGERGELLECGGLTSDGFFSVVRVNSRGEVIGYLLGDGTTLAWKGQNLVESARTWSVSGDPSGVFATGARRARENRPPLSAQGRLWLPSEDAKVFADGVQVENGRVRQQWYEVR